MTTPAFSVVGRSVPKRDAVRKVTGSIRYTGDLAFPGLLHAAILRSPYPHARIKAIDTSDAEAIPGVIKILHQGNVSVGPFTTTEWDAPAAIGSILRDQLLFSPVVRYAGEPVAAVAALDAATAAAAAEAIMVEYEPLPAILDPAEAMAPGAPPLHTVRPDNVASHIHMGGGDLEAGFAAADQVIERRFVTSRQKQTPMEPFNCVADFDGEVLTLWTPNQTPHAIRAKLADVFGLPTHRVRIITPALGGGFGARTGFIGEPWAAALAMAVRRPVRLTYSRMEDFIATEGRNPANIEVKVGFKNDGALTAIYARAVLNTGAYASQGPNVAAVLGSVLLRQYRCPNRGYDGYAVLTNAPPSSAFRGFGGPQAMFALEQVIDEIAERVGKDPLQYRREHLAGPGDTDYLMDRTIENDGLFRCLDAGAEAMGWSGQRSTRRSDSGVWRRGIGMAATTWLSGTGCLGESLQEASVANMRLNSDGTVTLITGVTDCGTGPGTSLAQIAAEELGMPLDWIQVVMDDTDVTPVDLGAHASRTLFVGGLAVQAAARQVREQATRLAAKLLETSEADLVVNDGQISVKGAPNRSVTYGQVARRAFYEYTEIGARGIAPQQQAPPYGAQFAEVEVNVRTGQVRVLRLVAAHDVGRAINPVIVEGQIEGGAVQGIGFALSEDMPVDQNGQPTAVTFMDYRMLTSADVPMVQSVVVEAPDPAGPFGAKAIGEPPIIPTAAAVANAIYDAVGVRLSELPMSPQRILSALTAGRRS